ncbi:radical SAM protein with 4Fe4S-binding SPASM domain [Sporomusaceae bacterium BoRhaA]|uniref:radical SAM/SPASM domain-containing protein n=1 Tax=Pelorhabdus rhamnosifermentans TaxID=2772457 RepID=UPI001C063EAD|nr:radical SAM/SPASM domain-containing protein [Pelorhabdus rhamnosifermentans]MBU2703216.1 radical SAM protein with 4Fe4S-binding SPASM domain [Pelorhabdus rhamnosifermentans]
MSTEREFTIINRQGRQILKDIMPLKKPLSIFIEPTNICNFRCAPCVHGNEKTRNDLKPFINMDMELFNKIINNIKSWDGNKLKLVRLAALGEPLLHPNFLNMVRITKEADIAERVDTFTNASLLDKNTCEKLVDYGLDYIRVSIYSVIQNKHNEITRTNIDIQKIRQNVANLRRIRDEKGSRKPYILVKMFDTYSEENDIFINMYKDIADKVEFEKVNNATKYSGLDLIKAYYNDETKEEATKEDLQSHLNQHIACPKPFMSLVINSNGDVLICTHDAPKATKIASVKDKSLAEIWKSNELFEFRKMHLEGNKHLNYICKNCDWYKLFPMEDNVDGFPIEKLKS